jgi:uncharacterized glyoxalase superfamily protein PhnB
MNLPNGHQPIIPYLMLKGALKFIDFTKKVFNAVLTENMHRLNTDTGKVTHSEITIDGCTIMFTDATEQWKEQTANLFIYVEHADSTYHKALDAGATTVMDLSDQNYGRTCGVLDPFGNTWWITSIK